MCAVDVPKGPNSAETDAAGSPHAPHVCTGGGQLSQRPPSAGSGGVFLEQWADSELHAPTGVLLLQPLAGGACGADDGAGGEGAPPLSDALQALVVDAVRRQAPLRLHQHLVLPLVVPGGKVLGALLCESPDASRPVRNSTSLQHAASAIAGARPTNG